MFKINRLLSLVIVSAVSLSHGVYGTSFFLLNEEGEEYEHVTDRYASMTYNPVGKKLAILVNGNSDEKREFERVCCINSVLTNNRVVVDELVRTEGFAIVKMFMMGISAHEMSEEGDEEKEFNTLTTVEYKG